MMKLEPADFSNTVLDDAMRLRRLVIARNRNGNALDEQSAIWIIMLDAWRDLQKSADFFHEIRVQENRLMGLPVRITIYDQPDTPRIQLLMEPMLQAGK